MKKNDGERLLFAIGELDDELIAEAERPIAKRKFNFGRIAAIAACLVITVSAVAFMPSIFPGIGLDGNMGGSSAPSAPSLPDGNGGTGKPEYDNESSLPGEDNGDIFEPPTAGEPSGGEGEGSGEGNGDSDDGESSLPYEEYLTDGARLVVRNLGGGLFRLRLTVTKELPSVCVRATAEDGGVRYLVAEADDGSGAEYLGAAVITVDGEVAENLPQGVGEYDIIIDISGAVGDKISLGWVLYIKPFGEINGAKSK